MSRLVATSSNLPVGDSGVAREAIAADRASAIWAGTAPGDVRTETWTPGCVFRFIWASDLAGSGGGCPSGRQ